MSKRKRTIAEWLQGCSCAPKRIGERWGMLWCAWCGLPYVPTTVAA